MATKKTEAALARAFADAKLRATPEAITGGHQWQLEVLNSACQNVICICSRRAGKSELACGLLLLTAQDTAGVSCIYLGLTKDSAGIIWRKWKRLLRKLRYPAAHSDSEQLTVLPNGSRVLFTGTDDTRRITHLLGDQLSGGCAILDECQDDPGILQRTVEDVLSPMLDETTTEIHKPGRLVLLGTVPDVPAGYFWRTWSDNFQGPELKTPVKYEGKRWGCFAWSRFDNPFETDNEQNLQANLEKYRYERTDPEIRRRWFGERVFSAESNAYRFQTAKHVWSPAGQSSHALGPFALRYVDSLSASLLGLSHYVVGIDQAQRRDRFAMVVWGWNPSIKDRFLHVAEAVTEPGADPQESEWLEVCKLLRKQYGGSMEFCRDAGGSSAPVNDLLQLSHGITIVSAVKSPGSVKARVQRLADLFQRGVAKVMEGSELEQDLLTAKWSMKAREAGKWEFDKSGKSPDLADAASYALDLPSFTTIGAPKPKPPAMTEAEFLRKERDRTLASLMKPQPKRRQSLTGSLWRPAPG